MKIEKISIRLTKSPPIIQAYIIQYSVDHSAGHHYYNPIYELGTPYVPSYYRQPIINIKFGCPSCGTEYDTKMRYQDRGFDMVCVCGTPLHIFPEVPRQQHETDKF